MNVTISISVASFDEAEQLLRDLRAGVGSAPLALTVEAAGETPAAPKARKAKAAPAKPAPAPAPVDDADELGQAVGEYAESNGEGDALDFGDEAPAKPAAPAKAAPAKAAVQVTPETIKLRVRELVEGGEMARVQKAFASVGAKKLSEIPADKLAAVLAALQD